MIAPLPQIKGVPDDLIRALNERLRQIDTSPGTKANAGARRARLESFPAAKQSAGDLFVEMDRQNALYQIQAGRWLLVSGSMTGTLANRPIDLGTAGLGLIYRASDTFQEFRWSGTAWVETTAGGLCQLAYATGLLTLTAGTFNDVPGATLTRSGRHLITASFDVSGSGAGDVGAIVSGALMENGSRNTKYAVFELGSSLDRSSVFQQWNSTATAGDILKLQAQKGSGTGATAITPNSSISALWVGP